MAPCAACGRAEAIVSIVLLLSACKQFEVGLLHVRMCYVVIQFSAQALECKRTSTRCSFTFQTFQLNYDVGTQDNARNL